MKMPAKIWMRLWPLLLLLVFALPGGAQSRRRMTPVDTPATATQPVNETRDDTSRINAKHRANPAAIHYHNDNGYTVYLDTITGEEWVDSASFVSRVPKMEFPLLDALSVGINVWDPVMRIFGQHYGIADAWVELSLHNRYKPIFEVGLGTADNTPSGSNFTYRSPMSVYFRVGANYNFLYNSNPDYSFFAGLRYGIAPFSYSVDNITLNSPYWGETATFSIPSTRVTAGWIEVGIGLRVKIWGPISAGWTIKYQSILHESSTPYGKPWYIPGFGSRGSAVSGSFSVVYTIPLKHLNKKTAEDVINEEQTLPETSSETPPEE